MSTTLLIFWKSQFIECQSKKLLKTRNTKHKKTHTMKSGRIKRISLATKLDYGVEEKMTRQKDVYFVIK